MKFPRRMALSPPPGGGSLAPASKRRKLRKNQSEGEGNADCDVAVAVVDEIVLMDTEDEDENEALATVTVSKSVSRRVKKKMSVVLDEDEDEDAEKPTALVKCEKGKRISPRLRALALQRANEQRETTPPMSDLDFDDDEGVTRRKNKRNVARKSTAPSIPVAEASKVIKKKTLGKGKGKKMTNEEGKVPKTHEEINLAEANSHLTRLKAKLEDLEYAEDDSAMPPAEIEAIRTVINLQIQWCEIYLQTYKEEELRLSDVRRECPGKRFVNRADTVTTRKMREANKVIYQEKRLGDLKGINVGDEFISRAEMQVLGVHPQSISGIDYISTNHRYNKEDYPDLTLPIATAIVLSGQYEDDVDNAEEITYTGQGGNDHLGTKYQLEDQKMTPGSEALKNSMNHNTPVRVIRGRPSSNSTKKVYTYDGLYKVDNFWDEKGKSSFTVYKFHLTRIPGQPSLTAEKVNFSRRQVPIYTSDPQRLVCPDISGGLESFPIPAYNDVDDSPVATEGFRYLRDCDFSTYNITIPPPGNGCSCKGKCTIESNCACAEQNDGRFPYFIKEKRDGTSYIMLDKPKTVIYECGPNCSCGPDCVNRATQKGVRYPLELFRTEKKGWGVRSLCKIPKYAPVCEYTGIIMKGDDLNNLPDENYIFDIDCIQRMGGEIGEGGQVVKRRNSRMKNNSGDTGESDPDFGIDARPAGGVARFINHSCDPNLFVQCVLSSHRDLRLARIVLFAYRSIRPKEELGYDYGMTLDSVKSNGEIKQRACFCGAESCKKRLH